MLPVRFILSDTQTCSRYVNGIIQTRGRRRTTAPPHWVPKKHAARVTQFLTPENERFLQKIAVDPEFWRHKWDLLKAERSEVSPLRQEPWPRGSWTPNSKRTGVITQKIGVVPQWTEDGEKMQCSILHVLDNHVISYIDPDTWFKQSTIGKKKALAFGRFAKLTVGAINNPNMGLYTTVYRNLFQHAGVPPKKRLASFMVTEDAALPPGTPLYASHFLPGQFVDVTGKTIDWGFQGVVHRWGFRGGQGGKYLGVTKTHRRPGSTGSTGDSKIWPGKRLPGHMGWEWRHQRGVQIMRIDHVNNLLYVNGFLPGDIGEILLVKDSFVDEKCVQNPPFPTRFPQEEQAPLADEVFHDRLFRATQPTVTFEQGEDEDYLKSIAKAAIKKQAKAKRGK